MERLAYTKKRYLSPKEIAAFVLVNFGKKNLDQFTSAFKEFFMIQFLKLNTTAYANINLFASIYDAADDTISGLIIDRTRTRWGRIRPFLILSLPMWLIGGYMMFTAPDLNSTQKIVWSAIGILLYGLGMSYFGAYWLLVYNITPNNDERNNLITTTKFFELFGTWLPSLVPVFVQLLPKVNKNITMQGVYSGFAYCMLILCAGFSVFGFFNMRERVPLMSREEMNETSVLQSIKEIFSNRPLFAIILSDFFNNFKAVGGSSEQYFWLNNTGAIMNQTICGLFTGIPNYLMVPMAAKLVKRLGARVTAILAGVFGGVAYFTLFFIGYHPFGQTFGDHRILNFIWVVFQKLATSITSWMSGMVLTWINYIPLTDSLGNAVPQTDPGILSGIWAVFCILPGLARGLYGLSFLFYNIHGDLQQQMIVELAEKRAARLAEQNEKTAD